MKNKGYANLIPFSKRSKEEARECGRKGGIASGKKRTYYKKIREGFLDELIETDKSGKTAQEKICSAIVKRAIRGDVRAFVIIRDTIGEKPCDKVRQTGSYEMALMKFNAENK